MQGKRVTVMGLGRHGGGVAVARWLAEQGCRVTVTDVEPAERLEASLAQLKDVPIEKFALGRHESADFSKAHIVVVNPAVRPNHRLVKLARKSGAIVTSEIELFLERCPATVVGVTGTTGKSTTCSMLAEIFRQGGRCTWLGGNIGVSLLPELRWMQASDMVVLELSSFQLAHLSAKARMPQVAVVTNCSPNHLDWHGNWAAYCWAKQRLLAAEGSNRAIVLNTDDEEVSRWTDEIGGELVLLVQNESLPELCVPGLHNRQNARLAATTALLLKIDQPAIQAALQNFAGLPHRLEFVSEVAGRKFINDSKATSPAATIAALATMEGRVWLLAGGVEHGADWNPLAMKIREATVGAAFYGEARQVLNDAVRRVSPRHRVFVAEHLADATAWAFEISKPGDTILLSPACPSFDQFSDFAQRGQVFIEMVHTLANTQAQHG